MSVWTYQSLWDRKCFDLKGYVNTYPCWDYILYHVSKSGPRREILIATFSPLSMNLLGYRWFVIIISLFIARRYRLNGRPSQWCHNEHNGVSNHLPRDRLLKRLVGRRSKKTPNIRVTGLCEDNSLVAGEFSIQRASNAENVSIWWRHHAISPFEYR